MVIGYNMLVNDVLYIHIPKTAGTSTEYFLGNIYGYSYNYIYECVHSLNNYNILHLGHDQQHNPIHYYRNLYKHINFIFTIVRNPYSRLLSAYSFYKNYIEDKEKNLSIEQWFFTEKINNKKELSTYNHHIIPQHWYTEDLNKFSYICKYETLDADINYIKNILNIKKKINYLWEFKTIKHHASFSDINNILRDVNLYYEQDFILFNYQMRDSL